MKITNIPQGKSYVPGVKIAGLYLQNFNFNINDTVIVNCQKNKVVIKKATEKDIFNRMALKNPTIITLQNLIK